MRRRDFVLAGAATLFLPAPAQAQKKTPIIGLLWNDSVKPSPQIAMFVAAMRGRGYVLDRDFHVEDRVTLEGYGGYAEGAANLLRANVDLIVATGSTATVAVAKATKQIPIVTIMGTDPVAIGLAASLSRPGGNLTGVLSLQTDLTAKHIELIKQLVPGISRVGVVLTPNVGNPAFRREAEAAGRKMELQMQFVEVGAAADLDGRLAELLQPRVGAIYVAPSSMLLAHRALVVASITKRGIPAVYNSDRYVEVGGLMAYGSNLKKNFVLAAGHVDRILKGARPGDLPIEQTAELELIINMKTAKALGIKIPQSILVRADRMIE